MNETEAQRQKRIANAIKAVLAMPGWEYLELELMEEAKVIIRDWKNSTDENLDRQYKAEVKAIDTFFNKIKHYAGIKT